MSPLTLKDGTVLPAGSYVCVPSMDPESDKSDLTREFDGFRWERMRNVPGNESKFLSVTTGYARATLTDFPIPSSNHSS